MWTSGSKCRSPRLKAAGVNYSNRDECELILFPKFLHCSGRLVEVYLIWQIGYVGVFVLLGNQSHRGICMTWVLRGSDARACFVVDGARSSVFQSQGRSSKIASRLCYYRTLRLPTGYFKWAVDYVIVVSQRQLITTCFQ